MPRAAETKGDRIQVRLDAGSKAVLKRAARYRHKTVSQFVLATALEEAEKVLRENEMVMLSGPDWTIFYDALTDPPARSAGAQSGPAQGVRRL
jgi:uncharacterized protein (DUF1778 family)